MDLVASRLVRLLLRLSRPAGGDTGAPRVPGRRLLMLQPEAGAVETPAGVSPLVEAAWTGRPLRALPLLVAVVSARSPGRGTGSLAPPLLETGRLCGGGRCCLAAGGSVVARGAGGRDRVERAGGTGDRYGEVIAREARMQAMSVEDERMLITRRRIGEKIVIGKDITITVLDISRDQVKVGIEAPREVPVYRLEYMPEEARPKCEVKS